MKKIICIILIMISLKVSAQDIVNTLGAGGSFLIKDQTYNYFKLQQSDGHVGIGSNVGSPRGELEIGGYDGLLVTGQQNVGTARALGAGVRMHWYPRKGAFRVGMAETSWWDDDGSTSPKLALYSIGMGYQPRASGTASVAIGAYNKATGDYALSLGSYSYATASHAIAIGTQVYASGIYSIALGAGADTNGKDGSVVIGDDTYFQTAYSAADNQLTMRFSGGYRLWSSYPDSTAGVYMRHGQSGWSNYSNRDMKENFEKIDGEWILNKINNIPITKWNYKKTDPTEKYIGPMAQDFYAAFHLNGTDSLGINSISMDGINMAAIQALIKRTTDLNSDVEKLSVNYQNLLIENEKLKEQLTTAGNIKEELTELRKLKDELKEQLKLAESFYAKSDIKLVQQERR